MDTLSFCLYGSSFISMSTYSNIAPFFPDQAHHRNVDSSMIGYIFSAFPFASLIFSAFIDKVIFKYGRKNCLVYGSFFQGVFIILFGLLYLINDQITFSVVAIFIRFFQGVSNCFIFSAIFALFAAVYPDDYEKRIGINQAMIGLGLMIGPMLGAVIYKFGGFFFPFGIFGTIQIIFSFVLYIKLDASKTDQIV